MKSPPLRRSPQAPRAHRTDRTPSLDTLRGIPGLGLFETPTLRAIGLFSERIEGHFREMFAANFGEERANSFDLRRDLPSDLDAWIESS
jgi:hypothetical protein